MSKADKFREIFNIAEPFAKTLAPGGVGKVLDVVNGTLNRGGASGTSAEAIQKLAEDNDQQTQAILALHERLKAVETKLAELSGK